METDPMPVEPQRTESDRRQEFDALFSEFSGRVLGYALRRAPRAEAEEIVSDVFLNAWRRLDDVPADPLPWLLATARNVLRNQRRSGNRRGALATKLELHARRGGAADPADEAVRLDQARFALEQLTEAQREAVLLVAWDGLTPRQAAKVLGCSQTALAVRLHRARRSLAAALDSDPTSRSVSTTSGEPNPLEDRP